MFIRGNIICRALVVAALAVTMALGIGMSSASAMYNEGDVWGKFGTHLGTGTQYQVSCQQQLNLITTMDPISSRAPVTGTYANATQLIEMWPRLDYHDGRAWKVYRWGARQYRWVAAGQVARFTFDYFQNVPSTLSNGTQAYYRVGYYYRYSVNGTAVGGGTAFAGVGDYWQPTAAQYLGYCIG